MRAALCKTFDGPSAVTIEEVPEPAAGPGEVVVQVRAAALNFLDTLMVRNKYQFKPELPFSPCAELAGTVTSLGPGVAGLRVGQRVMAFLGWGAARERVAVAAERVLPVPAEVADEVAAGLTVTYGTAMHGLIERGGLRAGETLAVLGASGGAGLAAVEIGARLGARVIAAASSAEKLAVCQEHGASVGIDYTRQDLKEALRQATGGKGVDVVYDCVGGDHTEPALRSLAWGGRLLVIGFAGGGIPRIPANLLLLKGAAACGVFWGEAARRDPAGQRSHMAKVLGWVAAGELRPHVHKVYRLEEIGEALGALERREVTGKAVVRM